MRPQDEVFNIAWEPPADQLELGTRAGEGVRHPKPRTELLHVPPMSDDPTTAASASTSPSVRRRLDGAQRPALLAEPGGAGGRRRSSWSSCTASSREQASEFDDPAGRRQFLKLMGASLALAGLTGCTRQPEEKIVPYVQRAGGAWSPAGRSSSRPRVARRRLRQGVLVESHMGRPTKIEGNPEHPASLGATDAFGAGGDPRPLRPRPLADADVPAARSAPGATFVAAHQAPRSTRSARSGGAGLRILTETVTSPTLAAQMRGAPAASSRRRSWHQWEPVGRDSARAGALLAFGRAGGRRSYRLRPRPTSILSLDADFLSDGPAQRPRTSRDFAAPAQLDGGRTTMNRLYAVESTPSLTGRHGRPPPAPCSRREVEAFARALAAGAGRPASGGAPAARARPGSRPLVKDLQAQPRRVAS